MNELESHCVEASSGYIWRFETEEHGRCNVIRHHVTDTLELAILFERMTPSGIWFWVDGIEHPTIHGSIDWDEWIKTLKPKLVDAIPEDLYREIGPILDWCREKFPEVMARYE